MREVRFQRISKYKVMFFCQYIYDDVMMTGTRKQKIKDILKKVTVSSDSKSVFLFVSHIFVKLLNTGKII